MTQAQLNFTDETLAFLEGYGLKNVTWSPVCKSITCQLDDTFSLVIYKKRQNIKMTLKKHSQTMSLPFTLLESLCDLKESIQLLCSFLEGQSKEQAQ